MNCRMHIKKVGAHRDAEGLSPWVSRGVYTPRPLHMIDTSEQNLVKIFREITLVISY